MCKNALGLLVLLLSGVWAQAQQSLPGYAVVGPDQGSSRPSAVVPTAGPPEPVGLGATGGFPGGAYPQAPGGYLPGAASPGMGGYPPGYGAGVTGIDPRMQMGAPGPASSLAQMVPGGPGGPGPMGPGGPMGPMGPMGGYNYAGGDPGLPIGPINTLGTETFWFQMDYVAGFFQKPRLSTPLITEGSPTDAHPGALNQPGTVTAFGDNNYKFGTYQGFDISLGANLTDHWSVEVDALLFPSQHVAWTTGSDANGNPLIARPVFNAAAGAQGSFLTSLPGTSAGYTDVEARSELWGIELAARYRLELTPYLNADFLIGYRSMELLENIEISDGVVPLTPSFTYLGNTVTPGPGVSIQDYDRFATNNTFNGVDFGARLRWQSGFDWLATTAYVKEAIGATTQTVNISGATSLVTPGGITTTPGGILAQQSNSGNFTRTVFGSLTDGGVGIIITPWKYVRFEVGYSAMYWNSVVRPGNQINPNVTYSQVPSSQNYSGTAAGNQPSFTFHSQGFMMQTLNVGMSFYY